MRIFVNMLYTLDLKKQIVSKLRAKGFSIGALNSDSKLIFPYVELEVTNDLHTSAKVRNVHQVTVNVQIIANGKDELKSLINNLQEDAMDLLESEYVGDEHAITFMDFDVVQYIEEEDESFNIYRRIIPCIYLVQTK